MTNPDSSPDHPSSPDHQVLDRVDAYLDAVPRTDADVVDVGAFTLFVGRGAWPYYARPARNQAGPILVADVRRAIDAARERGIEPELEWVHDLHPELVDAVRSAGMSVSLHPLLVYGGTAAMPPDLPAEYRLRLLDVDDDTIDADLGAARAVTEIAFAGLIPERTDEQPAGESDRELAAAMGQAGPDHVAHLKARLRAGYTALVVVADEHGTVAAGSVQPIDAVRARDGSEFGAAEVVGIATLPSARRRGLGGAITTYLTELALARGADLVLLSAADEATAQIYRRAGYLDVGQVGAATMPPSAPEKAFGYGPLEPRSTTGLARTPVDSGPLDRAASPWRP